MITERERVKSQKLGESLAGDVSRNLWGPFYLQSFSTKHQDSHLCVGSLPQSLPSVLFSVPQGAGCLQTTFSRLPLGRFLTSCWQWKAMTRDWMWEGKADQYFQPGFLLLAVPLEWMQGWAPAGAAQFWQQPTLHPPGPDPCSVRRVGSRLPAGSTGCRRNSSIRSSTATWTWGHTISFLCLHPWEWCSILQLLNSSEFCSYQPLGYFISLFKKSLICVTFFFLTFVTNFPGQSVWNT